MAVNKNTYLFILPYLSFDGRLVLGKYCAFIVVFFLRFHHHHHRWRLMFSLSSSCFYHKIALAILSQVHIIFQIFWLVANDADVRGDCILSPTDRRYTFCLCQNKIGVFHHITGTHTYIAVLPKAYLCYS